jgi:hypothetical protein
MTDNPSGKFAEIGTDALRTVHHLKELDHCEHLIKASFDTIDKAVKAGICDPKIAAAANHANVLGRVVCTLDDTIATGCANALAKVLPEVAGASVKSVVKAAGPLSWVIGMGFVVNDTIHAPEDKKLETFAKGTAVTALQTGALVLGTALGGPLIGFLLSTGVSFIPKV